MKIAPPGSASASAGFDQPFAMLAACHDRVRSSLDLLTRLLAHLPAHGCDASAREAARDVLRYFDLAAPQHHEDEERHVFPRLLAEGDATMVATVRRLQGDHAAMALAWTALRGDLESVRDRRDGAAPPSTLAALAAAFMALYAQHLQDEDDVVFPSAAAATPADALAAMGDEMAVRRGATRMPPR